MGWYCHMAASHCLWGGWQMQTLGLIVRGAILYVVSLVAFALFATLLPVRPGRFPAEGLLSVGAALAIVHALVVAVLVLIAMRSRVRGWSLALLLFVALFGIQTAMMQIETVAFNASVGMALADVGRLVIAAALHAAVVALLAAWLFPGGNEGAAPSPPGLGWRIAATTLAYVVCYFAAGHFIAWSDEAVRAYYDHGAQIDRLMVLALQMVRGFLWSLLALFLVLRLGGTAWSRVAAMAVTFAVLTSAPLIYPNSYMPAEVTSVHLIEVAISEAIWGALAALLLGPRGAYRKE